VATRRMKACGAATGAPWSAMRLIRARKRIARRPGLGYRAGSRPVLLANQIATAASEPTATV
jgi:hypothetical protein